MESEIKIHLRRLRRLPKNLSSATLYGNTNTVKIPLNSLKEEFLVRRGGPLIQIIKRTEKEKKE